MVASQLDLGIVKWIISRVDCSWGVRPFFFGIFGIFGVLGL